MSSPEMSTPRRRVEFAASALAAEGRAGVDGGVQPPPSSLAEIEISSPHTPGSRSTLDHRGNNAHYSIAIIEGTSGEGTSRLYVPVLVDKKHAFYQAVQCSFVSNFQGPLSEALEMAASEVTRDLKDHPGYYVRVSVDTPEQFIAVAHWAREYLIPDTQD